VGLYLFFVVDNSYEATSHIVLLGFEVLAIFLLSLPFAVLCLFLTLYSRKKRNSIIWFVAIVAPAFTLVEWVKTWYFSGFPWFQASHVFSGTFFRGWYAIFGELGVSFIIYLVASLLAFAFINIKNSKTNLLVLKVLTILLLSTFFVNTLVYTKQYKEPVVIQVFSDGLGSTINNQLDERVKSSKNFQDLVLSEDALDFSIWPESSTGIGSYADLNESLNDGFKQIDEKSTEVLFGSYGRVGAQHKNSIFLGSTQKEVYTKQHLVPVGEYIPTWFSILDLWIPGSFQSSTVSDSSLGGSIKAKGLTITPMICYEVMFGNELRKKAVNSNLLVNVGNLGALKPLWVKKYFLNLAKIRSFELQTPIAISNSFGFAGFISKKGELDTFLSNYRKGKIKEIKVVTGNTPYSKYGSVIILLVCFALLCIGILIFSNLFKTV
jgi:apolipoprotein N-acyltransferase